MARPQHFSLAAGEADAALAACLAALRRGELVVLPTETVYGVAGRQADRSALDRLKGQRNSPYSLAVPSLDAASLHCPIPDGPARRVAQRWWPGPVTLVLRSQNGPHLGLRVPGHAFTRKLLEGLGEPLLFPSANRSGQPAPRTAAELDPALLEHVAVVVEDGPCALGEASSVIDGTALLLEVLREGVVRQAEVAERASATIAVVCSGNTCRSPMARVLLEQACSELARERPGLVLPVVVSAGLHAGRGSQASTGARAAMERRGLDLGSHRSRPMDTELLTRCDLILSMTRSQRADLLALRQGSHPRVELFDPSGHEVPDPFGGSAPVYEDCAAHLAAAARQVARLLAPAASTPQESRP